MPVDFWNSFVERFSNKFPTESPPKIPSDFRRVPTLPREIAGPYDTRWPIARVYAPLCIGLDENRFARARVHRVVYDARRLLLRTFVAQLLLHVCHGQWLSCATSCATHIWIETCSKLCNKLRKTLSADWSMVIYFSLCNEAVIDSVLFTLFYPSTSPNASFALISFFLHSLTKAPDNNTPAIKITSSSVSLEARFVARFVAAAFWRGWGQIFVATASCATKVRNKSLRVSSGLASARRISLSREK